MLDVDAMTIPFVDLKAQYRTIQSEVDAAALAVFGRGDFILGEDVSLFEAEFADFWGSIMPSAWILAYRLSKSPCGRLILAQAMK